MNGSFLCALAASTLLCFGSALAQPGPDPRQTRERELLRRQADQITALEQERAALAAAKTRLEDDLKKARAQAAAAARAPALQSRIQELETELGAAAAERSDLREQLAAARRLAEEQRSQLAEMRAALAAANERTARLDRQLAERSVELSTCAERNVALVKYGRQILDELSDGTCGRSPQSRWDPVLQFGRVRFENRIEEFRGLIAAQRYVAPAAAVP